MRPAHLLEPQSQQSNLLERLGTEMSSTNLLHNCGIRFRPVLWYTLTRRARWRKMLNETTYNLSIPNTTNKTRRNHNEKELDDQSKTSFSKAVEAVERESAA